MAQFTVLRPIEYNGKLYVPGSHKGPANTRSAGNGSEIPVDGSGVITLPESVATQFTRGQIMPPKTKATKSGSTAEINR